MICWNPISSSGKENYYWWCPSTKVSVGVRWFFPEELQGPLWMTFPECIRLSQILCLCTQTFFLECLLLHTQLLNSYWSLMAKFKHHPKPNLLWLSQRTSEGPPQLSVEHLSSGIIFKCARVPSLLTQQYKHLLYTCQLLCGGWRRKNE